MFLASKIIYFQIATLLLTLELTVTKISVTYVSIHKCKYSDIHKH
jgi:hypothetical protein